MTRSRNRMPPFRALQAFHAIAQSGSVSRAAAELQVSAGAVSQQIRLLEKHVGERISVTGSLVDREMQVKTLARVTTSCS